MGWPSTVPGQVINGFSDVTECSLTDPSSQPAKMNCSPPKGQNVKERTAMSLSNSAR
jgi:hypothetical protein